MSETEDEYQTAVDREDSADREYAYTVTNAIRGSLQEGGADVNEDMAHLMDRVESTVAAGDVYVEAPWLSYK